MASQDEGTGQATTEAPGASIVREEGRYVVDAQLRTLEETDRKAMATARVDAIVVGLLLSAGSLADAPTQAVNHWLIGGSALVIASLACAVLTYSVDRPSYGVGPGFIDDASDTSVSQATVETNVSAKNAEWIEENGDEIASNGTYLLVAQGLLVMGLTGIGLGLYGIVQ